MYSREDVLREYDEEMAITRRLLERVPTDKGQWKPHVKSFPLGHLAQLISMMPGWIAQAMRETKLDFANNPFPGYSFQPTEALLEQFDAYVADARQTLRDARDEDFDVPWSLTHGDKVFMTSPRREVVRQTINHLVHHRGQLSVYLRLVDVPLPSIYGPTADTPAFA